MPEPFHVVTTEDIWNSLEEVKKLAYNTNSTVGRMETKIGEHDKDIRNLNFKFYGILAGLIASLATAGIAVI